MKKESDVNDLRVKYINETISSIRLIKLYAWEQAFEDKIKNERNKQADLNKKTYRLQIISSVIFNSLAPLIFFVGTISIFVFFIDSKLTHQLLFFASSIFSVISYPIRGIPSFVNQLLKVKLSLDRLSDFLNEDESENYVKRNYDKKVAIEIKNKAKFVWRIKQNGNDNLDKNTVINDAENQNDESSSDSTKTPFALNDIEIEIKKGELTAIIGQVRS